MRGISVARLKYLGTESCRPKSKYLISDAGSKVHFPRLTTTTSTLHKSPHSLSYIFFVFLSCGSATSKRVLIIFPAFFCKTIVSTLLFSVDHLLNFLDTLSPCATQPCIFSLLLELQLWHLYALPRLVTSSSTSTAPHSRPIWPAETAA